MHSVGQQEVCLLGNDAEHFLSPVPLVRAVRKHQQDVFL